MVRAIAITIWKYWDPIYFSFTRLQYLVHDKKEGVFRVRLTRYKGKEVELSDGNRICKNDLLLKIHLHNVKLLQDFSCIQNEILKGKGIFKQVKNSMPLLASYILNHPEEARIKGIIGITLINKGFKPLGFESVLPVNKFYCWFKKTTQIPIILISSSRVSLDSIKKHHPVYLMMSKDQLIEKYKKLV